MSSALLRALNTRGLPLPTSQYVNAQRCVHHHMERHNLARYLGIKRSNTARANRNTHENEAKFRAARGRKFVPVPMPDDRLKRNRDEMSAVEIRIAMLRQGINPGKDIGARTWQEAQLTFQSFYGIVDNYVPREEPVWSITGNLSEVPKEKFSEVKERVKNRWNTYWNGTRRIKKKEGFGSFRLSEFVDTAEDVYKKAFAALAERDQDRLLGTITEHAYGNLWPDVASGTLEWELIRFKSPSKVVAVRCADYPHESGNDIAQITVRMHIEQKFALYDRFGKLRLGYTTEPVEAIEYVVFENHIASVDSAWRFHDKIRPQESEEKTTLLK